MKIDINNLNCEGCSALKYLDINRIIKCEELREKEFDSICDIRLFLLGESIPAKRFVYDRASDYSKNGLRFNLRNELVKNGTDEDLFVYLRKHGIMIVDCALCPLHKFNENKKERKLSAKICFERHTHIYLDLYPQVPIITFFPKGCGFNAVEMPNILKGRIKSSFQFCRLDGLKDKTEAILTKE